VNTTVFITPSLKSKLLEAAMRFLGCGSVQRRACFAVMVFRGFLAALMLCMALLQLSPNAQAADIGQLKVERAEDGVYLSANVRFELPTPVEDALVKGIAMFFVVQADIYQSRL
jgi:hypothetical protein